MVAWHALLAVCVLSLPLVARAAPGAAATDCTAAAAAAERALSLPPDLLLAVGLAESGQPEPGTRRLRPVPYIINVGGTDVAFSSAAYAVGAVAALRGRGVASIDVGCFQVNLHYHPGAFASLEDAFDARRNAQYAGFFLRQLFERTGSWAAAVAAYHSAEPALGDPYRDRVMRFWHSLGGRGPPTEEARLPLADPHVIRISRAAAAIPVYTPATLPAALRASLAALTTR